MDEFKDGIWIRCRSGSAKLFNISGLLAKTRTSRHLLYSLLFADDMGICAHSENMLQNFINKLSKAYGLSTSLRKTEIMVQVPPTKSISLSDVNFASSSSRAQLGSLPVRISIDGVLLKEVDHFV